MWLEIIFLSQSEFKVEHLLAILPTAGRAFFLAWHLWTLSEDLFAGQQWRDGYYVWLRHHLLLKQDVFYFKRYSFRAKTKIANVPISHDRISRLGEPNLPVVTKSSTRLLNLSAWSPSTPRPFPSEFIQVVPESPGRKIASTRITYLWIGWPAQVVAFTGEILIHTAFTVQVHRIRGLCHKVVFRRSPFLFWKNAWRSSIVAATIEDEKVISCR